MMVAEAGCDTHRLRQALLGALVLVGVVAAFTGGYGSDNDTYLMLRTFRRLVVDGQYVPSRFTGYPVAELGLGALAWFGGAPASNLVTFALFLGALPLFHRAFVAQEEGRAGPGVTTFALLALSQPVLFFDSVQSMDYAWAQFFFALGCFLFARHPSTTAVVLSFALAIGSRPSHGLFVLVVLAFPGVLARRPERASPQHRLLLAAATVSLAACFFVPAWVSHDFGLGWLGAAREPWSLATPRRFVFRVVWAIGPLAVLAMIPALLRVFRGGALSSAVRTPLVALVASNLALYLWMPLDPSYLQPMLFSLLLLVALGAPPAWTRGLVALQLTTWLLTVAIGDYRVNSPFFVGRFGPDCTPAAPVTSLASWKPTLAPGIARQFADSRWVGACWPESEGIAADGAPLRLGR